MPISEPYNPINDPAINPFRKRTSSNTEIIKRFVTAQTSVSGGGNGVTTLDDPTYLGFSLRFDILSPLFNGATNGEPQAPPSESTLVSELGGALGLTEQPPEASIAETAKIKGESAVGYLKKVGEATRASYLMSFIQGLREVNAFRPYYWQTIEGLQDAWSNSSNMLDPYNGTKDDDGIVIGCLEAIDLKISALFSLYRSAVLDNSYNRFVLPKNLSFFDVYIDVYEIRNFKSSISWLDKINSGRDGSALSQTDVDRFLNENTSKITFKFCDCTWNINESGKIFEKVTNAGGAEMASTSMKWGYKRIEMESIFSGYDQSLADGKKPQSNGSLSGAVKDATTNAAQNAANSSIERLRQAATARVQGLLLGNVFGIRNQVFSALQNPGILSSAIEGAGTQIGNLFGARGQTGPSLGDDVFDSPPVFSSSLPTENIFIGEVDGPSVILNSTNIFGSGAPGPSLGNTTPVFSSSLSTENIFVGQGDDSAETLNSTNIFGLGPSGPIGATGPNSFESINIFE